MTNAQRHTRIILSLLSRFMGGLFILSSLLKFQSLPTFQDEVKLFLEAYFPPFLMGYEQFLALATCLLELVMGVCALVGFQRRALSVAYLAVLSFFVWLTGINLFSPSLMGSIESCGCFGEWIHFSPLASFIKCVLLWTLSLAWFGIEYFTKAAW